MLKIQHKREFPTQIYKFFCMIKKKIMSDFVRFLYLLGQQKLCNI